MAHEFVNTDRCRPQRIEDTLARCFRYLIGRGIAGNFATAQGAARLVKLIPSKRGKNFDDVVNTFGQRRPVANQPVGTAVTRVERRARDREHFAALFAGQAGGDQGAGPKAGLDDHDAEREAGYDSVAAGKMATLRFEAERCSDTTAPASTIRAYRSASPPDRQIDTVGDHRDGAGLDPAEVSLRVDSAGHPRTK